MKLADRIEQFEKAEAFITVKGHTESFVNNPTCRLRKPSKNELEKISEHILEQINKDLTNHLTYNHWKNTSCVIEWFKNINEKNKCALTQLDIKELYTLITEDISENAITFAKTFISINDSDLRIVKHCRKSLLFSKEEDWKKTSSLCCRDVTMGSYDGTEMRWITYFTRYQRPKNGQNKEQFILYEFFKKLGFRSISWPF